ncbi:MAG: hypothetical protein OXJ62_10490 [Spirochaetaceae bacterium]|nr:hypothetical protein [Spirochaetaceae bacterium]
MTRFSVLLSATALVVAITAMSAGGSGIRDAVDPDLTDEVEALVEGSVLREYAGLGDRTPIPPAPVPVAVADALSVATGIPGSGTAYFGAPFVEIPLVIDDGHTPLTDLDALYGVYDAGLPAAAAPAAPAVDLVDDTPAMIATAWLSPPLDAK